MLWKKLRIGWVHLRWHRCRHLTNSKLSSGISFGGIGPAIFDRVSETMFTRYVLGLRVVEANTGKLTIKMPYNKMLCGDERQNIVDSGAIATLMDHSGGLCAWSTLTKPTQLVSTVDLRIDYVSHALCGETVLCDTTIVDAGDKFIRTDIKCWNEDRTKLISVGRGLFNIYMSPLSKLPLSGAWMESVALALPSTATASIVRFIERLVVWRLQLFPRKVKKGEHHKHFRTNLRRSHKHHEHNKFSAQVHNDELVFPMQKISTEVSQQQQQHQLHKAIVSNRRSAHHQKHSTHLLNDNNKEAVGIEDENTFEDFVSEEELPLLGNQLIGDFVRDCEMNNTFIREVLELRVVGAHDGLVIVSLPFKKRFIGNFFIPCLHGGLIATVMKSAGHCAARTLIDVSCTDLQLLSVKISYLKPAPCEEMICEAEVMNADNGMLLVHMRAWDSTKTHKIASGMSLFKALPL